ncbi:MAG: ATP-binding protein [Microscillaceae bacterium]|nr:ATP-binding protein [Microscillaceae bacterium]
MSNAIKYRQPHLPPQILIRGQWQEEYLALSVQDNGMGIDLEQYEGKLFQLYKRFHFHVEGKGMGLFLVNSQVKALKGRISVESRPGAGTCFTVFLPKRRGRSEAASFLST